MFFDSIFFFFHFWRFKSIWKYLFYFSKYFKKRYFILSKFKIYSRRTRSHHYRRSVRREGKWCDRGYNTARKDSKGGVRVQQAKETKINRRESLFLPFFLSTSCSFFLPLLPLSHSFLSALFRSQNRSIRESDHKVANLYQENLSRYRGNLASRKRSVGLGKKLRWEKREVERRG